MKILKIGLSLSVVLYAASVGVFALLRSRGLMHGLSTAELFYGPAITIACAWIIFAIVHALLGPKKNNA